MKPKDSTTDRAHGALHELKGKVKQETGKLINDEDLEAEGLVEKHAGKAQQVIGKVEKALGD